jgi:3-oxoacyl-[acyl-carrier protein] reductase
MKIRGKAAVVTGGGRGVGRATALALAKQGCSVLVHYRNSREGADAVVEAARALGVKAISFGGDVREDSLCRAMMQRAHDEFGRLDILVNSAGTTRFIPHEDLDAVKDEHWDEIFSTNVKAVFQCTRAAAPFIKQSGGGEIVTISSIAGILATGSSIPYCASKAAVISLTVSTARVLAPEIRVNSVAPGFIAGEWLQEGLDDQFEQAKAERAAANALQSVCEPKDVAEAVLSLITGSDQVTGQTLVCDSGTIIGSKGF